MSTEQRITDEMIEAGAQAIAKHYGHTPGYYRADVQLALEAAVPLAPRPVVTREAAAKAAAAAILYNLPIDAFGDQKRLEEYAAIWGNSAAAAVLALIERGAM